MVDPEKIDERESSQVNNIEFDELVGLSYDEKLTFASEIAKPMASKKLAKKIYKLIKKASKTKYKLSNGLKDVQKRLRKGEKGIVILAGNVTPLDVMSHVPAMCELREVPYCYIPSRYDLGTAMGVRRGTLMVMIKESDEYNDLFLECQKEIATIPVPF